MFGKTSTKLGRSHRRAEARFPMGAESIKGAGEVLLDEEV